jgi:hypothetical protein
VAAQRPIRRPELPVRRGAQRRIGLISSHRHRGASQRSTSPKRSRAEVGPDTGQVCQGFCSPPPPVYAFLKQGRTSRPSSYFAEVASHLVTRQLTWLGLTKLVAGSECANFPKTNAGPLPSPRAGLANSTNPGLRQSPNYTLPLGQSARTARVRLGSTTWRRLVPVSWELSLPVAVLPFSLHALRLPIVSQSTSYSREPGVACSRIAHSA